MGMAASQARYLALTARKSNVEYEGQQINQARTALANQSANYFNQMLAMDVPAPPDKTNFTTVQYSFSDGYSTEVLSNYYQLGNKNSDYNYVVTTYHNEKVFTGQRKRMNDPQIQYTTDDVWSFNPSSIDSVRPKIVDKAVRNPDGTYSILTSDGTTHVFSQVQTDGKDEEQVRAINLGMIISGSVKPDISQTVDLRLSKDITIDSNNPDALFNSIASTDSQKIDQLKEIYGDSFTDINDYVYSATANDGKPAYALKSEWKDYINGVNSSFTAKALTDRYNFSLVDKDDTDTINALAILYGLDEDDIEKVKNGQVRYYTDGHFKFVTAADYEGIPEIPEVPSGDVTKNYTWDNTIGHFLDDASGEIILWPGNGHPESFKYAHNGNPLVEYTWDETTRQYLDAGGNVYTPIAGGPSLPTIQFVFPGAPGTPAVPAQPPSSTATVIQGEGTSGAFYSDGRGNFVTFAELEDAVAFYNYNTENNTHIPINIQMLIPTNNPRFSNYTQVGNCRLTELSSADVSDSDTYTELIQIIKDMKSPDGSQLSAENIMACFDTDPTTGELVYKGGLYTFTMGGEKYYTTRNDLDTTAGTSIVDNDIDVQQKKLVYYRATYLDKKVEDTQRALLETDGKGRFATLKLENDSVTYTLNVENVMNEDAYNDAMNRYYYEEAEYEKQIADINARTEIIQAQDRTLELRMMQLGTEQSALQNEMEAVKKVIDKHVELGFKTFGG